MIATGQSGYEFSTAARRIASLYLCATWIALLLAAPPELHAAALKAAVANADITPPAGLPMRKTIVFDAVKKAVLASLPERIDEPGMEGLLGCLHAA
jgi:hypothetical protein